MRRRRALPLSPGRWPGGARSRRRARRPTTCTGRAWSSIRAPIAGSIPDWRGRPWHETVLYELHAGALGGFAGVQATLPGLAGARHHRRRADADQRFSRHAQLGLRRRAALCARPRLRHARRAEGAGRCRARPRPDDLPRRRLQSLRPGRELSRGLCAAASSATTSHTPWGAAIDFRRPEVRRFFTENALYWLHRISLRRPALRRRARHRRRRLARRDGGRGARHRRAGPPCPSRARARRQRRRASAARLRRAVERRCASRPACPADRRGATATTPTMPRRRPTSWRAAWPRASSIRASRSAYRKGKPRGTPSADLPPTAFVLFLQNHDQIGNRPFGDRLTDAAPIPRRWRPRSPCSCSARRSR